MKKVLSVIFALALITGIVGCNGIERLDAMDKIRISNALILPWTARGNPASYMESEDLPDREIAGFTFIPLSDTQQGMLLPDKKLSHKDFLEVLTAMEKKYGKPSYVYGSLYYWVSGTSELEIGLVYDTDIYNCVAIGIER